MGVFLKILTKINLIVLLLLLAFITIVVLYFKLQSPFVYLYIFALFSIVCLFIFYIQKNIKKSLANLEKDIELLHNKDLRLSKSYISKDELSLFSQKLNDFVSCLESFFNHIKKTSAINLQAQNAIMVVMNTIAQVTTITQKAVESVNTLMKDLNKNIDSAESSAGSISIDSAMLSNQIETQVMMIENSIQAIQDIAKNIDVLYKSAENTNSNSELLVKLSLNGKEALELSNDKIVEIERQSNKIEEVVEIIIQIAGQTNILAMNAEIEAAHAGEFGRGFAVVAEEIRKLAEASSEGSKEISQSVAGIIKLIKNAKEASLQTNAAFQEIDTTIHQVNKEVTVISDSLNDVSNKSTGIMHNMVMVKDISDVIDISSKEVAERAEKISLEMRQVDSISETILHKVNDVVSNALSLQEQSKNSTEAIRVLKIITEELHANIENFKTHEEVFLEDVDLSKEIVFDESIITKFNGEESPCFASVQKDEDEIAKDFEIEKEDEESQSLEEEICEDKIVEEIESIQEISSEELSKKQEKKEITEETVEVNLDDFF